MATRLLPLLAWAAAVALAAVVAARARYTTDLSAFLPRSPTRAESLLVAELRDGLVSRTILLGIEGADAPARARLSRALAARLRTGPEFAAVLNGELPSLERDRRVLFGHRYLLSDQVTPSRFEVAGLGAAIGDGLALLASPAGLLARDLFVRDPTGEFLEVLGQLDPAGDRPRSQDGVWVAADASRALLLVEMRAAGSDTDAAEHAVARIRAAFAREAATERAPAALRLSGPPVFAVQARASIRDAAVRLSTLSTLLIAALLLAVYRSPLALALGFLPVVSGALAGVAAVALGFGVVHGVTLGFGVTLIGESVDYSVYLFVQSQRAPGASAGTASGADTRAWTANLWPTVRLGMLTSVCGFASLLPSAFPGLAELGLYSIAGLLAAAAVTRFVLPPLLARRLALANVLPIGRACAALLRTLRRARPLLWAVPVVAAAVLLSHRERLWSHELSALSPVPASAQALDASLRTDLGEPDTRLLVVVVGRSEETVLEASEAVGAALDRLVAQGTLGGYRSPSRYLPSAARQEARRASLPPRSVLAARLEAATAALPIRSARLGPFLDDVEAARGGPPVRRADLEGTSLAPALDALLVRHAGEWSAMLPLQPPTVAGSRAGAPPLDAAAVTRALAGVPTGAAQALVVDLKGEADALYRGYLGAALRLCGLGLAAIVVLLYAALRSAGRVARVLAPLGLAVVSVITGFALAARPLTLLHLVGLLLIVAVGSNYALFFDRESLHDGHADHVGHAGGDAEDATRLLASLAIANLCTVIGFGVLAFSAVPVLAALGSTVAPGALLALLFSAAFAQRLPGAASAAGAAAAR